MLVKFHLRSFALPPPKNTNLGDNDHPEFDDLLHSCLFSAKKLLPTKPFLRDTALSLGYVVYWKLKMIEVLFRGDSKFSNKQQSSKQNPIHQQVEFLLYSVELLIRSTTQNQVAFWCKLTEDDPKERLDFLESTGGFSNESKTTTENTTVLTFSSTQFHIFRTRTHRTQFYIPISYLVGFGF
jgi:hypothetical protein